VALVVKKDIFPSICKEFCELNLSAFNSIFSFSPSMDLPYRHVPKDFNPNALGMKFIGITGMVQVTLKV